MKQNSLFSWLFGKLFGMKCKKDALYTEFTPKFHKFLDGPNNCDKVYSDGDQPEATDVFNSQVVSWAAKYSVDRTVGHVIFSDEDHLKGEGEVSATYKVTPLHAFDDQSGHGDYYLVDATYVINNKDMYHPNHANYHGGVRVRIGGFCLTKCEIETTLFDKNGKIDGLKMFAVSPKPETFIDEHNYVINNGWNIGGSVTGGIAGGNSASKGEYLEGTGQLSFNWGVSHSKSESYKVSDLIVRNNSNVDNVKYELVNTKILMFDWFSDYGFTDCSDFAKANLTFHSSWIWYIPNAKDFDKDNKLTIRTMMCPTYKSARFYSTYSDYDDWHDTFIRMGDLELDLPNRQPTGIVTIKNDTDETITNVTLYDKDKKVAYASQSSFASGTEAKFCMPTGEFSIEFKRGKKASEMKTYRYTTSETFDITRCNTLNLVASFDFEDVEYINK